MTEPPRFEIIPDGHEHCWHVANKQHLIHHHRDDICCHCGKKRCVSLWRESPTPEGHGPYASETAK